MVPISKQSTKKALEVAARVMAGKDYSTKDVRTLAASVIAQAPPKPAKRA